MTMSDFFNDQFNDHADLIAATRDATRDPFIALLTAAKKSISAGGKILLFGNGGSAADCQHIATELTIRYISDRAPIAAIALTTDTSALTAAGNDLGFDAIFSRQIEALAKPGDIALGISTSGNSQNILLGLQAARKIGAISVGFTGRDGGKMQGFADPLLIVPSNTTARIQEMHIVLGHLLCGALEKELGLL